jgi:very-short-patch-repair endonuclease
VDGGQHSESVTDKIRDQRLTADGYQVLRFWNNDVLGNLEGVLTVIQSELIS